MSTKENLLALLEVGKGSYYSGEEITQRLGVSRAAVWKAIKSLRNDGYQIDAITNKGYCLSMQTDILSPQGIQKYLSESCQTMDIAVLSTVSSTNVMVREKANIGAAEGYTLISNEQTAGRGRYGRQFFSPYGTGIYMSLLLRPQHYEARQALSITTMAAVAMCEAIEAVSDETAQIKWVNDIYVRDKKVCGILTEASFGLESGTLDYLVLGVGLNVYQPEAGFPAEIESIAGAIFEKAQDDIKNKLTAAFINRFMAYYHAQSPASYTEQYRSRSLVIGKPITVTTAGQTRSAVACGIDDDCRLLVRYDTGEEEALSYGEIKVHIK